MLRKVKRTCRWQICTKGQTSLKCWVIYILAGFKVAGLSLPAMLIGFIALISALNALFAAVF